MKIHNAPPPPFIPLPLKPRACTSQITWSLSRGQPDLFICVSRQLEKDSLQSIQHLLQVITLSVEGPMKSKAARRFPSTTCQGHFSLKNTLETRLSRDARKSSRKILSPDTLFFLPLLSEERESTWRGLFFSCIGSSL